ncbi:DUF4242 domain-containing protein [Sciscionella sediminilitoris]|uniref:DUF4242 domain-containing protein n=1 Tax=Sciscionella sediminilitoris TaxID=1445613 RepID=UPI0004DF28E0|nr:DUF4242 domain-containing protein [Sciscionella sp. SE31]
MQRYVIERNLPNAGALDEAQLRELASKSNDILVTLGDDVRWVESYVTEDKLYCVYEATDPDLIAEHARRGEFPCDRVSEVRTIINPQTGT